MQCVETRDVKEKVLYIFPNVFLLPLMILGTTIRRRKERNKERNRKKKKERGEGRKKKRGRKERRERGRRERRKEEGRKKGRKREE